VENMVSSHMLPNYSYENCAKATIQLVIERQNGEERKR